MNKHFVYGLLGGMFVGGSIATLITHKIMERELQSQVDEQAALIRLDYARYYSGYEKPETKDEEEFVDYVVADTVVVETTAAQRLALQAKAESDLILANMGYSMAEIKEEGERIAQEAYTTDVNVFDKYASQDEEDEEKEEHGDMPNPDHPYLITSDEYIKGERYPDQLSLRYFEEDDTLIEDRGETPVSIEDTIGTEALTQFGRNPKNRDTIHVRNEKLQVDFEVQRDKRSYTEVILGIQDTKPAQRKFRDTD